MLHQKDHRFTVRMDITLYEELRSIAFNKRKTINGTVVEMLESGIRRIDPLPTIKNSDVYANAEEEFCPDLPSIVSSYRDHGLIAVIKTLQFNSDYILIFNVDIKDTLPDKHIGKASLVLLEWPTDIVSVPNSYWKYVVSIGMPLWWLNSEVKDTMDAAFDRWIRHPL